jgi:hypothetical protein
MRRKGFKLLTFGRELTTADKNKAISLNAEWDQVRTGAQESAEEIYPVGSVGEGYQRAIRARAAERAKNGVVWTKEQQSRDDWPRAWKHIRPVFGDVNPNIIEPEDFLDIDKATGAVTGFIIAIEKVSITERHRTIKVWRALWNKLVTMKYIGKEKKDPSLMFANTAPKGRADKFWNFEETKRLVQRATDEGYKGLAALLACAWDSQFSPVDCRKLTPNLRQRDDEGAFFQVDRTKTGRAAAGTLTAWSEAILDDYIKGLPAELKGDEPIFRNRSGTPYSKDTLGDDFRDIRALVFGKAENRQLADLRRSGTYEALAGGATRDDISLKMANNINVAANLQKTYEPVNVPASRRVDQRRAEGRERAKRARTKAEGGG